MAEEIRILHLEDSLDDAELVARMLRQSGLPSRIRRVADRESFTSALAAEEPDVILSDYALAGFDGMAALDIARVERPHVPFIFVSGTIGEERAVDMLHRGATDYVLKDRPERLVPGIRRALREAEESVTRRRAQEALRESQKSLAASEVRYRLLFDANPLPMWVYDVQTLAFVEVNAAACASYGYSREEFLAMTLKDIRPPEDVRALLADVSSLQHAIAAGNPQPDSWRKGAVWRHRRKDGTVVDVEILSAPLHLDERDTRLVLARDISAEQRLEDQLRQSQKMDAVGRLAGGVAHDFNNILFVISGYSEQVLRHLEPENPLRPKALGILQATDRAAALTRQLLTFSRKDPHQPRVVYVNTIVLELEKMFRRLIGEDIALTVATAADLGRVVADPAQMEQVLMNLAVNARDAMPRGGRLIIETHNVEVDETYARSHLELAPGAYVLLSVSDTGCGMDARTQEHIFEPFFTTKAPDKGTGLGLSIVYGIVKRSGGSILCYSHEGRGTTFKVYLPRTGADATAEQPDAGDEASPRGTETVLVVEDEGEIRFLAREALEEQGYCVVDTPDGAEALDLLGRHPEAALLVTDMVLQGMTGQELAERARASRPGLKVLFMSGYTRLALAERQALPAGAEFLQKPFTLRTLLGTVREVLDAP